MVSPRIDPPARAVALHWFRNDLRLDDNPALLEACQSGTLLALFIDETDASLRPRGGAKAWFLHQALASLDAGLRALGSELVILRGEAREILPRLAADIGAGLVTWNRRYGEAERAIDAAIKAELKAQGIAVESRNGHLLYEPMEIRSQAGGPMRVFTPFWRACRAKRPVEAPLPAPARLPAPPQGAVSGQLGLADLALLPTEPDWASGLRATWQPGEAGARKRLLAFLKRGFAGYAEDRNRPDLPSTSMLSPHLSIGDLSVRRLWQVAEQAIASGESAASAEDGEKFLAELGWREFSYHLLYHYPTLAEANYQPKFNAFPWEANPLHLRAWQRGRTGYPIVDAGMRQLWQTGFMHNRVRMIVASFLVKHLLIDWRAGENWFWDTLCDADPASNAASWQWVAGSGADAAPYFRIFNPFTQGEKFDPAGDYVRTYLPELAKLPEKFIHRPWEAPGLVLARAGVTLGETYPRPIVAHEDARMRALEAFRSLPNAAQAG